MRQRVRANSIHYGMAFVMVVAITVLSNPEIATAQSASTVLTPPPPPAAPSGLTFGFSPLPPNPNATPGQIIDEVKAGLLVHDFGFVQPVFEPFDRQANPVPATTR